MRSLAVADLTIEVPGHRLFESLGFRVPAGSCLAVVGPSGSGKTSLLNCLAGIMRPSGGTVTVGGVDVWRLRRAQRAAFRLRDVGMVFQFGELIPELDLLENVSLPLRLAGTRRAAAEAAARDQLVALGLEAHLARHPAEVSGGEMQRAAVARALVHGPRLVLADEPTGSLDRRNAREVTRLLVRCARDAGAAVVVATHDPEVAAMADAVLDVREFAAA
jgi:ABC-type lipoprotein export system ATPase subunit